MKTEALRFTTDIIKPWEKLNKELGKPYCMNSDISDFTSQANSLAVSLKHILESCQGVEPKILSNESHAYKIISDLADSYKHGKLKKANRECKLDIASMYERRSDAKVRFLRNKITIHHNTRGKMDFMEYSKECAIFLSKKLEIDWSPVVFNNSGEFTSEIRLHASKSNQVSLKGMTFNFIELDENGKYKNVDLNGEVLLNLTFEK